MSVKSELEALQREHEVLPPETVVTWAKAHPRSALHKALEWDNSKAGHLHRLQQVRQLISIHVRNENNVRQIVSLSIDRKEVGGGYRALNKVLARPALKRVLLSDALAELERVRLKYESLRALAGVWRAIARVRTRTASGGARSAPRRRRAA